MATEKKTDNNKLNLKTYIATKIPKALRSKILEKKSLRGMLKFGAQNNLPDFLRYLLATNKGKYKSDHDHRKCGSDGEDCNTPLMDAAREGHVECVKIMAKTSDGGQVNGMGMSAIYIAILQNKLDVFMELIKHEAELVVVEKNRPINYVIGDIIHRISDMNKTSLRELYSKYNVQCMVEGNSILRYSN